MVLAVGLPDVARMMAADMTIRPRKGSLHMLFLPIPMLCYSAAWDIVSGHTMQTRSLRLSRLSLD